MTARILIVEDEAIVAAELESRLQQMNYEVCATTDNADDACHLIETLKPEIVLLDIGIRGDRDGLLVGEFLRKRGDTPFVYVTAHDDASTIGKAGATGPFGYILKPFQDRELQTSIEMALHRHDAEMNYRKLKRWLSTTLESIGDGVIATDRQGRITFINRAAEALTGWEFRTCVGRPYSDVFRLSGPKGQELLRERIQQAIDQKTTVHCEEVTWLQSRKHGTIAVEESVAPICNEEGDLDEDSGVVIVFRDSSRRLKLEQERLALERQIQESQRLDTLGTMASGIAHDFNNLLAMIQGSVSLCQSAGHDDLAPMFSTIEQAVERGTQLCGQMLAYAAKGVSCNASVNLNALTTSLCSQMTASMPGHITLQLKTSSRCSDIAGDIRLLEDVLRGLILNSLEALEETPGTISVTVDTHPGWVSVEIRDTGPGIQKDLQPKVFEPFFTTKFHGRGLGLAAVTGVVRNHGGKIELRSEPGFGTTMVIWLPSIDPAEREENASVKQPQPPEEPPQNRQVKLRCLVVDDEAGLRELVRRMLDRMGYAVDEAEDGLDAVQQIESHPTRHDFILMDLTMPKLGGRRALEKIRQIRPEVPTILMSGYEAELADSASLSTPFLHKPFSLKKLSDTIEELNLVR